MGRWKPNHCHSRNGVGDTRKYRVRICRELRLETHAPGAKVCRLPERDGDARNIDFRAVRDEVKGGKGVLIHWVVILRTGLVQDTGGELEADVLLLVSLYTVGIPNEGPELAEPAQSSRCKNAAEKGNALRKYKTASVVS